MLGVGIRGVGVARGFIPASLFAGGTVQGAWYDPSDLTTLFQDSAGTTPVTAVEQAVGLMLDKSKGLVPGPELVTNGDFAGVANGTDVTTLPGWAAYGTPAFRDVQGERLRIQATAGSQGASLTLSTTIGKRYIFKATVAGDLGLASIYSDYTGDVSTLSGSVNVQFVATATSSVIFFRAANNSAGTTYYDNISVRELPGNHAFNSSGNSANFPVLSARVNLLTADRDLTNGSYWVNGGAGAFASTANSDTAPDGTNTACKLYASGLGYQRYQANLLAVGSSYTFSVWLRTNTGTAAITLMLNDTQVRTTVTVTTTWTLYTITGTIAGLLGSGRTGLVSSDVLDATKYVLVGGCDLRVANDGVNLPAYQRVNTSTDYDTVGFKPYLRFNGTNQWLQTNSIDFSATDKMFVSAGVRKLSDAAIGAVLETSANSNLNNGAIWLLCPGSPALDQYSFRSKGTSASDVNVTGYAAPITNVLSGIGNISGDQAILRINGTQAASSTADQGTGNYGNYPLYIGARAGSSLWFNGRLYGMVVAGKQASAAEITSTETYINQKTGAY